jgi:hypothetical protein
MPGIARRLGKPAFRSSGLRRLPGADRDDVMALDRSLLPHRCGEDGIGGFADDPLLLCLGIKFAMDSLLEGGVSSEPVSEVEVLAPGNYDTIPRPLWMIIEAEKGYFGLKTAEFQSLLPWQLHCHLGPKLLMTRSFLPSGVLVAGEFTVYKRAGTSALSARPAKNLILFSHLECQGAYTNLPRSRRSCPLPI